MTHPPGTVQGLCSAGATCFAVCVAFLGVWGFQGQGDWRAIDVVVLVPLVLAALSFALTPLLATRPVEDAETYARYSYCSGTCLLLIAVIAALYIGYVRP